MHTDYRINKLIKIGLGCGRDGSSRSFLIFMFLIMCLWSVPAFSQRTFVSPGLSHKKSDLERMRFMVEAGIDPWYTSYQNMRNDSRASYNYNVRGNLSMTELSRDPGINHGQWESDVRAAYFNALMWVITGDRRHADKSVEIFNAWTNLTTVRGGGTESLNAGLMVYIMLEAAEIIKGTYDGWHPNDMQRFKDMLVYPGYSTIAKPAEVTNTHGSFYWRIFNGDPGRHGNQDLFGWRAVMAMGVFLENEIMYERGLRYFMGLPAREDDIPYVTGPPNTSTDPISTNEFFDTYQLRGRYDSIADYGYNGVLEHFILENGQCQESSRDQDHTVLGVGLIASMAEIAWNQGDDVYSYLDNRILSGYEFSCRYNVSYRYAYPDQPSPWEPTVESGEFIQRRDRSGRWYSKKMNPHYESNFVNVSRGNFHSNKRPIYEIALAHYGTRLGLPADEMKWTLRARDISIAEHGYEQTGWSMDHLGWGGLTVRRPEACAGDPVNGGFKDGLPVFAMNVLPATLQAVDFDYFAADGNGRTYLDHTSQSKGNNYRQDADVDIEFHPEEGYHIAGIEAGEWLSYTVYVPIRSKYEIIVRYAAANGNGKIGFNFGGEDNTDFISLPFGGGYSDGLDDWKDFQAADAVLLEPGVQNMRLKFAGESNAFKLKSISVLHQQDGEKRIELHANAGLHVALEWTAENVFPGPATVYRAASDDFSQRTTVATHVTGTSFLHDNPGLEDGDTFFYWVAMEDPEGETILSNAARVDVDYGLIDDSFEESINGWSTLNAGAMILSEEEILKVFPVDQGGGWYRADLSRRPAAILHGGRYPIAAIKVRPPDNLDISFGIHYGTYGRQPNTYTDSIQDVYYYDMREVGFGVLRRTLDEHSHMNTSRFEIRLEGDLGGKDHYEIDWIKTFSSVQALYDYLGLEYPTEIKNTLFSGLNYHISENRISVKNLPHRTHIRIIDLMGRQLFSHIETNANFETSLPGPGVYILQLFSDNEINVIKLLNP